MNRTIRIPCPDWSKHPSPFPFRRPVKVDWPELQLTEEQMVANAAAMATDKDIPYPDPSIIFIEIARPAKGTANTVFWYAEFGDIELSDTDGRVLLFATEDDALKAGIAEFEIEEYVYAIPAVQAPRTPRPEPEQ